MQVLWGLPGLQDAKVADVVFASCALPGIFPPREILGPPVCGRRRRREPAGAGGRRRCAGTGHWRGCRVDQRLTQQRPGLKGFAATYIRGLEIVMQTRWRAGSGDWTSPPLVLMQPRVEHVSMFGFGHNRELIEEGYRSTLDLLDALRDFDPQGSGIHPQRRVEVRVDRERCIGCGACVMHAPWVFELDPGGKAKVIQAVQSWSPIDGAYVRNCPTYAISARLAQPAKQPPPLEISTAENATGDIPEKRARPA